MIKISLLMVFLFIVMLSVALLYVTFVPEYVADLEGPEGYDLSYEDEKHRYRSFSSNGEEIYYTGINESGDLIDTSGDAHWIYMYGGGCVNCHGTDGRGGIPIMMGNIMSPDIRYSTLSSGEHHMNHVPYDEEALKIAITEGIDSEGIPLDMNMPRWKMIDEDLDDLIGYLKDL